MKAKIVVSMLALCLSPIALADFMSDCEQQRQQQELRDRLQRQENDRWLQEQVQRQKMAKMEQQQQEMDRQQRQIEQRQIEIEQRQQEIVRKQQRQRELTVQEELRKVKSGETTSPERVNMINSFTAKISILEQKARELAQSMNAINVSGKNSRGNVTIESRAAGERASERKELLNQALDEVRVKILEERKMLERYVVGEP